MKNYDIAVHLQSYEREHEMTEPTGPYGDSSNFDPNLGQGMPSYDYQSTPPPPPAYGNQPPQYQNYPQYGGYNVPSLSTNFEKPIGWFIVNWLFLWPLAIYSLVVPWNKMTEALAHNDLQNAQVEANKVRKLGKIALLVSIGIFALYVILIGCTFAAVSSGISYP